MKLLLFLLLCACIASWTIADFFRDAEACQPGTDAEGQPLPEPQFDQPQDREFAQGLADHFNTKRQGKG